MASRKISYREKIENIFSYILEPCGDHDKAIDKVETWLLFERLCDNISSTEYSQLKDMVEPIARRMIKEL